MNNMKMREKQGANSPVDMMEALRPHVSSPLCCLLQGHDDSTELVLEGRGQALLSHSDMETESTSRPVEKEVGHS